MPYPRILTLFLLFVTTCFRGLGQYNTPQNKVWVFGDSVGIDFNSGSPDTFTSALSSCYEGSASVCDATGKLLFYTNGKTVWNKLGMVMSNGVAIVPFNTSGTSQSSVIVPVPGSASRYYIFSLEHTDDHTSARSRLAYTIVDMMLAGGLGDVTGTKGIVFDSFLSEKLMVVPGNDCDFWLMAYRRVTNKFVAYHITIAGIDVLPVESPGAGGIDSMGVMKISPNRQRLVKMNDGEAGSNVTLCNFDANTGIVSGCNVISSGVNSYGAEFSPDNSKLYIVDSTGLYQFNISLPTLPAIISSQYRVMPWPWHIRTDLRLAPNERIYLVANTAPPAMSGGYLSSIDSPNGLGNLCHYVHQAVQLAPNHMIYGLPSLFWSAIGPSITIAAADSQVCVASVITLSSSIAGGVWSSSNTSIATVASGNVYGVTAGVADIIYTSGNCSAIRTITVNPTPILSPAAATVCIGSSLTLSFGPTGGTWSESVTGIVTVGSGGSVHADNVGTTVVTYTLPGSCFSITSIAVNEIPVISLSADTFCANTTITLSFSPSGGFWTSSSTSIAIASATGTVRGISGGNAVISYSLGGCTASSSVTIDPAPDVTPLYSKLCIGTTLQISSSVAGGTWTSSDALIASVSSSGNVASLSLGTAIISYAAMGCVGLATVAVRPPPTAISGRTLLCQGYSTLFSNGISGGTWSSGSAAIATIDATGNATGVASGSTLISYTTAIGAGCFTTYSVTVVSSAGAGIITGPVKVCIGDSIALTDAVTGGAWNIDDPGLATVSASGVVSGIAQGLVTIIYTIADTCGVATAFKTITIGTPPDAGIITGDSVLCVGNTATLSHTASGGSWFSSTAAIASVNTGGVVTGIGAGNALIGYYVSNDCGSDTVWYPVRVAPTPSAGAISGLSRVCIGATFQLSNAIAGGTWTTSPVGVIALSSGGDVTAVGQGIRTITYIVGPDGDGCVGIATHSVSVTTVASFSVTATVTQPLCYGDNTGAISLAVLGDMPPYKYLWSTLDTVAALAHLADATYYSSVTETTTKCSVPDTFHIAAPPVVVVALSVSGDKCNSGKGSVAAMVAGGVSPYTYAWSNGDSAIEINALYAGTYSVSVTDFNGCEKNADVTLADTCSSLVIHDAITPNGDGINDVWVIEGLGLYPANTVQVFDKWGDRIFEAANYNNNWSATGKNGAVPDGTYYYLINLNAANLSGGPTTFTGSILVKR